jgi:hypothetical protein
MPAPNYEIEAGTLTGETRNEIYMKYGQEAYENTKYGWHHEHPHMTASIQYNLVPVSGSCKFLTVGITYSMVDITPVDPKTKKKIKETPDFAPDVARPTMIHFEWTDANIPFADKDVLERDNIEFTIPTGSFGNLDLIVANSIQTSGSSA